MSKTDTAKCKTLHKNPNVTNLKCSKCGYNSITFWFNTGYDFSITEKILCTKCANKEWGL